MSVQAPPSPRRDPGSAQGAAPLGRFEGGRSVRLPLTALLPVAMMVAAALVYGAVMGQTYPEFSDFALQFGDHAGYTPLSVGDVLGKYVTMSQGWYRPTSFYLVPYLLRLDYFQPSGVIAANIVFFTLAACSLPLLVRRAPLAGAFFAATSVLFAPSLYLIPYGAQIDSLYILFGVGFIAAMLARERETRSRPRRLYLALGSICFLAALTSKEISVLLPFLLVPSLLLLEPEFTWASLKRAVRTSAPYIVIAVAFVIVYKLGRPPSGGVYSTQPSINKVPGAVSLSTWTFGFRSPIKDYAYWIPPWSSGERLIAIFSVVALAATVALGWRQLGAWRIGLFALMFLGTAIAIALPGGLPHHTYPLVVLVGVGTLLAARGAVIVLRSRLPKALPVFLTALFAMGTIQVVQAHSTYGTVLYSGPQAAYLKASTELFSGGLLAPVRNAQDPLFVFEDCLGGLHNPLRYYAKAGDGEEVSVPKFDLAQFSKRFRATARQGRISYVAQCTGTSDPWYRLLTYDSKTRQMVSATP